MGAQNSKLRALKLGIFGELAYAMLVDAAMLSCWTVRKLATSPMRFVPRVHGLFALGHGNGYS